MRALLLVIVALIIYGSLFPFRFDLDSYDPRQLQNLFVFGIGGTRRGDLVANILLFLPFGFLAINVFHRSGKLSSWLVVLIAGGALALSVQVAQLIIPGRVPAGSDVTWNLIGCIIGALLGLSALGKQMSQLGETVEYPPIPVILAVLWVLYGLAPFVPSLDLQLLKDNIKLIISEPPDLVWVLQAVVMWLVVFHFLSSYAKGWFSQKYFSFLVFITLLLGFFVVGKVVSSDKILGSIIALGIWYAVRQRYSVYWLAAGVVVTVLLISVHPFVLRAQPASFQWIPFQGALTGSMAVNALSIFKKLILYGCLIWLLAECRMTLWRATASTAVFLLCCEIAQLFLVRTTPEITDPLLAIAIGITFFQYQKRTRSLVLSSHRNGLPAGPPPRTSSTLSSRSKVVHSSRPVERMAGDESSLSGARQKTTIEINLRGYQRDFLHDLASAGDRDVDSICVHLIHGAYASAVDSENESVEFETQDAGISVDRRNKHWTALSLSMDPNALEELAYLAERSGESESYTLRHLIEDYLNHDTKSHGAVATSTYRSGGKRSAHRQLMPLVVVFIITVAIIGLWLVSGSFTDKPSIVFSPSWSGKDATIIFDPHTHTRYSDGSLAPSELVALGKQYGCDALAITDHSDTVGSASTAQLAEIASLRQQYPQMLIFAGIELNMPSYAGREHVNVIAHPRIESSFIRQLGDIAQSSVRRVAGSTEERASDAPTLDFINVTGAGRNEVIVIYNHPSRKVLKLESSKTDILEWSENTGLITAIEGAPGHQNSKTLGSYSTYFSLKDRWDPVVAIVGGVWDQLLSRGFNIWGAIASSDYHNRMLDRPPCEFARTHISVADKTYDGVMDALRAGTFWADHGHILDQFHFSIEVDGLEQSIHPGSVVRVPSSEGLAFVTVSLQRGPGSQGKPLTVDIVSNCGDGSTSIAHSASLAEYETVETAFLPVFASGLDGQSCYMRARVRLSNSDEPDFLAHTNPIRIFLTDQGLLRRL